MLAAFVRTSLVIFAAAVVAPDVGANQWPTDPATNLPVGIDPNANQSPRAVSDGQGGVIVAWEYSGPPTVARDIYVQRIAATGISLWGPNGVIATSAAEYQLGCSVASDGEGGAIVAWQDYRNGFDADIYVQRVNANGNTMWSANGVPLCIAVNDQIEVELVAHQQGGAVAVWRDMRADGVTADVYAQRVSSSGVALWTLDGTPVCVRARDQVHAKVISPIGGGAIVVWEDERNLFVTSEDIYAQRLTPSGDVAWVTNGVSVCSVGDRQLDPQIVETSAQGAIIVWQDDRTVATYSDVYAQRVDSLGMPSWTPDGIPVCIAPETQYRPQIVPDGSDGAIICWPDYRNDASIFAQKVTSSGQLAWVVNGIPVCEADGTSDWPKIVPDQSGGAIIAWDDSRNAPFPEFHTDIYAQRISSTGTSLWTANGVAVSTAAENQHKLTLVSDSNNGFIAAWEDWRDGGMLAQRYEVYAQHVNADGSLGNPTTVSPVTPARDLQILAATPNPFGSNVEVIFDTENAGNVDIRLFSVTGRLVFRGDIRASLGENRFLLRGTDADGNRLSSGVYFLRLQSGRASVATKLVITR